MSETKITTNEELVSLLGSAIPGLVKYLDGFNYNPKDVADAICNLIYARETLLHPRKG